MSIILFLVILAILIFVHELGHFSVAKYFGVKVEEFALGFPPKVWGFVKGETKYILNIIPFGGYVKILGENPDEESLNGPEKERSLANKHRAIQASVLVAGVAGNIILAWILITSGLMFGLPASISEDSEFEEFASSKKLLITSVMKDSPAMISGLKAGDEILGMSVGGKKMESVSVSSVQLFINESKGQNISILYEREGKKGEFSAIAKKGIVGDRFALGISMNQIGVVKMPFLKALTNGVTLTYSVIINTAQSLWSLVSQAFFGKADFSQVSGPVGIVKLVGDASGMGFAHLVSFTALISINLAIINLIPFPALDGGRLLFVAIEAVTRKRIKPSISNTLNTIGFILLMILMVAVTYHDIVKLF